MNKSVIRSRFMEALRDGYSIARATEYANRGARSEAGHVPPSAPADEFPSDEVLRAAIKHATGKAPHWKARRETLIEQYKAL
jgi:hypothetical protein